MRKHYPITVQKFVGARFEDHGLDLDVLPELIAYKTLLVETAKSLWMAKNPDRERLKRNFEVSIKLKFYSLGEGSVAVPIEREYEVEDGVLDGFLEHKRDELDDAAELVDEAMRSADADRMLPKEFPKDALHLFADMGKTLRDNEHIVFSPARDSAKIIYTRTVRDRLLGRITNKYSDRVVVVGEVRAASIDGGRFTIRQDDGLKVDGRFQPDQEILVTDALREHASCRVEIRGAGIFDGDGILTRIDKIDHLEIRQLGKTPYDPTARPIWDIVEEIGQTISDSEWDKLPKDASIHTDRYLYGRDKTQS